MGSNLGEPEQNLAAAAERLVALPGVRLVRASRVFRTEPQELRDQPMFANQVLELEVDRGRWSPLELVRAGKALEEAMGREQGVRFGPRLIDIDLLLFGDVLSPDPEATVPHPRLRTRAFVLVPLAEIAPGLRLPDGDETVEEALAGIRFSLENGILWQPEDQDYQDLESDSDQPKRPE